MKVAVWDTYVTKNDGALMHFDIIVPSHIQEEQRIHVFLQEYLHSKNKEAKSFASKHCQFCHIEMATLEMEESIHQKGYYILEMQGCE